MTGSLYVGSAVNIPARWRSHRSALSTNKKPPPKLQQAWGKYGPEAFSFEVLLRCGKNNLLLYEQLAIDALKPKYNTRKDAASNIGVVWSAETNAKKHARFVVHEVRGVRGSIASLARHFGVVGTAVAQHRYKRGWSIERAVTALPESKHLTGAKTALVHKSRGTHPRSKTLTAFGVTAPLQDLITKFSVVSYAAVIRRRCLGWSLEKALSTPKRSQLRG